MTTHSGCEKILLIKGMSYFGFEQEKSGHTVTITVPNQLNDGPYLVRNDQNKLFGRQKSCEYGDLKALRAEFIEAKSNSIIGNRHRGSVSYFMSYEIALMVITAIS